MAQGCKFGKLKKGVLVLCVPTGFGVNLCNVARCHEHIRGFELSGVKLEIFKIQPRVVV